MTFKPFDGNALAEITEALIPVGLTLGYGFDHHARQKSSYSGSVFEWTERSAGTRFLLHLNRYTGKVDRVDVFAHPGKSATISDEAIETANKRIAEILAEKR